MSLSFWNQRRRNAAAMIKMQEEAKAKEEAEKQKLEEEKAEEEEKPQTKRGRKNVDEGEDRKS